MSSETPSVGQTSSTLKVIAILVALAAVTLALFRNSLSAIFPSSNLLTRRTLTTTSIPKTTNMSTTSTLKVTKRPWNARGHSDHGWLYTFHTFNFASYYHPSFNSFGPLRVINEDRVARSTGFGAHSHAESLIWSYIVRGELEHKDSLGNLENLKRGEVQFTSAGTGIRHSEYCRNDDADVHFLQIWAMPAVRGLKPNYATRMFGDELKTDRFCRIMESVKRHDGKDGVSEPIPLHADLSMSASILGPGKSVIHDLVEKGERKVYLHVVMGGRTQPKEGGAKIKVGGVVLGEGDGAFVTGAVGPGKIEVESVGDKPAEFLLFDMGM